LFETGFPFKAKTPHSDIFNHWHKTWLYISKKYKSTIKTYLNKEIYHIKTTTKQAPFLHCCQFAIPVQKNRY
jgi:hypothetical protein